MNFCVFVTSSSKVSRMILTDTFWAIHRNHCFEHSWKCQISKRSKFLLFLLESINHSNIWETELLYLTTVWKTMRFNYSVDCNMCHKSMDS